MARSDSSERGGRRGPWRRRQRPWNGPDHINNDNRGPVLQQFDGYGGLGGFRGGPRPLPPAGRLDGHMGAPLDELTLRHLAQDCSSVKNQLLKLKTLLQMEDGGAVPDVVVDSEDNSTALQMEDLMREVRELREELKSEERTIAQLTLQQQQQLQQQQTPAHVHPGRCHCHQRASSLRGDRRTQYDKATQTPWRGQHLHAASLHPSSGVLPASPFISPWQSQYHGPPRANMPQRRQTSSTTASSTTAFQPTPPPQRAAHPGKSSKNSPHRGPQ